MPKKHILLVDDEVDFAETMALCLQMRGYEIKVAHSGEEALKKVGDDMPDLILLDVMMPSMDGYEVCRRLRQDKGTRHIPIIILTAKNMPQDKVEGLQIGADDYITKSFEVEELFARIEALLRRDTLFEEVEREKALLIKELKRIIQKGLVEIVFQPIFYLKPRRLFAFEVLTHGPKDSPLENPEKLFQCALSYGMLFELEMMYRKKALNKLGDLVAKKLFFFNSSPYLIEAENFKEVLSLYGRPGQIVLEITERVEIRDFHTFCQTLNSFRNRGFKIAIDDVGCGYSSLDAVAELEPDFVKIDSGLIRGVNENSVKQNLVKAIMLLCKQSGITSIGEGIEKEEELQTLIDLGVDAGQGYFLGHPSARVL